ncbi:hypothetical protein V6N13_139968 [Hibiscus sabdariffa]
MEGFRREHVLRLCPQVRQLWSATIAPDKFSLFDSLDFDTWILQCFKHVAGIGVGDDVWPTRFSVICWLVWKKRCATVFGGASLHGVVLARYGNTIAAEFADAHASRATTKRLHPAPWCPPARGSPFRFMFGWVQWRWAVWYKFDVSPAAGSSLRWATSLLRWTGLVPVEPVPPVWVSPV